MHLIIVESPTKAKTLSRFLGEGFVVEATRGHIKDLPKSKLGVDVEHNFKPDYIEVDKTKENVDRILKSAKKAKTIFVATDPDREGEAIAQHVEEVIRDSSKSKISKDKLQRIVFHEITKEAVEAALSHPRGIDKNLVHAQIARRVLDRLVGYNLSPLLWRKVRRGLSAGRVQSVTVRLIVEREREIEKFKADEYWEIFCVLETKDTKQKAEEFTVQLVKLNDKTTEIKDGKQAREITDDLKKADYQVAEVIKREVRKNPYPPFTTSTMTQAGARLFGWSSKKTMSMAQALYEEGLITYHRTDATYIAESAIENVRKLIQKDYGANYLPEAPKVYKTTSKVAQEAHEAIRPTNVNAKALIPNSKYKADMEKLYSLIWKRFVACQMTASVYDETKIEVAATWQVRDKLTNYLLRASGQTMKFDGWRRVIPSKLMDEVVVTLPAVIKDENLKLLKVDSQQKFTQPPARYNEASLIKTLEKLGIGRPSTYAPTISTIQIRQYVEKKEGKFFATLVGVAVTDFLVTNFPAELEYSFTAKMENDLDEIANGKVDWQAEMKAFWGPFEKKIKSVTKNSKRVKIETEKLGRKCPECKEGELVIRVGRFGKFISCSRFPDCRHTEKYVVKIHMKCTKCEKGDIIVKKTKKGRIFYGCSRYPECDFASWVNPVLEKNKEKENMKNGTEKNVDDTKVADK